MYILYTYLCVLGKLTKIHWQKIIENIRVKDTLIIGFEIKDKQKNNLFVN